MPLASNVELPERYRVARHIASGGMASVWEVEDLLLGRVVAVKVLGAHFSADPGARARFQREARTAARVSDHPNVATIYDIGEHGDGAFIVMEYFAGGTVADRLHSAAEAGRRVPARTALRLLREAAAGLDYAHDAGIVHRDVKPANLLLDDADRLAVGDFGIARLADDTHMTQVGQVLGTAAYLSPEQAIGEPATAASDRYALAVVAYELLTGRRPFNDGPPQAQLRQHAEAPPPRPSEIAPDLPAAVDVVLLRGLAKNPIQRPPTATALVDEIELALTGPAPATERTAALAPARTQKQPPVVPASPPVQRSPLPPPRADTPRLPPRAPAPPRRSFVLPLLAVMALIVGGAVAFAVTRSGSGGSATSSNASGAPARTAARSSTTTEAATPPPAAAAPPAGSAGDPVALNDKGFELSKAGRYGEAVAPLQASVQGFRDAGKTDDITYAYALYNLGVALNRSGNPAAAVEVLQERMKYADQQKTVRSELKDALKKLGGGTADAAPGKLKGGNGNGRKGKGGGGDDEEG